MPPASSTSPQQKKVIASTRLFSTPTYENVVNVGTNVAEKVHPSIVMVVPTGEHNISGRGTGFAIDYDAPAHHDEHHTIVDLLDEDNSLLASGDDYISPSSVAILDAVIEDDDGNNDDPLLPSETDLWNAEQPSSVKSTNGDSGGGTSSTTTSNIEYQYIMTCAHVAAAGRTVSVIFPNYRTGYYDDSRRRHADVIARNETLDLALLRTPIIPDDRLPTLPLKESLPRVGTLAFAHGFPPSQLRGPAMTMGIVCGVVDGLGVPGGIVYDADDDIHDESQSTTFVVTDAAMSGGMSGGPLVDAKGQILGVSAVIRHDMRSLGNLAVSTEELIHFLESAPNQNVLEREQDMMPQPMPGQQPIMGPAFGVWLYTDARLRFKKDRIAQVLTHVAYLEMNEAQFIVGEAFQYGRSLIAHFDQPQQAHGLAEALRRQQIPVAVEELQAQEPGISAQARM